jgi:hypothetical protein
MKQKVLTKFRAGDYTLRLCISEKICEFFSARLLD